MSHTISTISINEKNSICAREFGFSNNGIVRSLCNHHARLIHFLRTLAEEHQPPRGVGLHVFFFHRNRIFQEHAYMNNFSGYAVIKTVRAWMTRFLKITSHHHNIITPSSFREGEIKKLARVLYSLLHDTLLTLPES